MAHADYECCACCDERGAYTPNAGAKEMLCSRCAVNLAERGVFCHDVDEFCKWLHCTPRSELVPILVEVGYRACYYLARPDDILRRKGVEFDGDRRIVEV